MVEHRPSPSCDRDRYCSAPATRRRLSNDDLQVLGSKRLLSIQRRTSSASFDKRSLFERRRQNDTNEDAYAFCHATTYCATSERLSGLYGFSAHVFSIAVYAGTDFAVLRRSTSAHRPRVATAHVVCVKRRRSLRVGTDAAAGPAAQSFALHRGQNTRRTDGRTDRRTDGWLQVTKALKRVTATTQRRQRRQFNHVKHSVETLET